jgi:methyl-accepting chemotaxis protein
MERASRSVSDLVKRTHEITRRVSDQANEGGRTVEKSIEGIGRVARAMTNSTTVMRELNKQTGEISSIVGTINIIAERTNLLSLNASIEAARAGDAGRGFAVVAEEIRNLADRCAKATADIAHIVRGLENVTREATETANEGARLAEESNRQSESGLAGLKQILSGVGETSGLMGEISRATDEQLTSGRTVVEAINTVASQARQVAAGTAEQAKGATTILQASAQMRKVAKEVAQAMGEHSRASREVIKAAQSTNTISSALRKAMAEQTTAASDVVQAMNAMRQGAASTTRAVSEQATATEQVSKEADRVARLVATITRAMTEQSTGTAQIASGTDTLKLQSEQTARALAEQSRAVKDITLSTQNIAKQIRLISDANVLHSQGASGLAENLQLMRDVVANNVADVEAMHAASAAARNRRTGSNGDRREPGRQPNSRQASKSAHRHKSAAAPKPRGTRKGRRS